MESCCPPNFDDIWNTQVNYFITSCCKLYIIGHTHTHALNVYYICKSSLTKSMLLTLLIMKAPKSCHITPILRSLHWLRITERIEYKLLSITYKVLTTTQPPYLHKLISTQRPRSTRCLSVVTLARPASSSSLKITDRSFRYASPCLWNQLPFSLRKPHSGTSSSISCSPIPSPITSCSDSPLCTSITPSLFHFRLKTYLFHKSYPLSFTSSSRTASPDFLPAPFLLSYSVFDFNFFIIFRFWAVR